MSDSQRQPIQQKITFPLRPSSLESQQPSTNSSTNSSTNKRPANDCKQPPSPKKSKSSEESNMVNEMAGNQVDVILSAIKESGAAQLQKMDTLEQKVDSKFSEVNTQIATVVSTVKGVDDKLKTVGDEVDTLTSRLNELEQDKLATVLEISGITDAELENSNNNLRKLVEGIFKHFGIPYDNQKIEHVRVRELRVTKKKILIVQFKFFSDKLEVLGLKFKSPRNDEIYFDHALTPTTRYLFAQAKKIAREAKIRGPRIISGKIFVTIDDGRRIKISNQNDIDMLRKPAATTSGSNNNVRFGSSMPPTSTPPAPNVTAASRSNHFINAQQNDSPLIRFAQ